eukprot:jgi/Tetstr1/420671/TSEL_011758.t1
MTASNAAPAEVGTYPAELSSTVIDLTGTDDEEEGEMAGSAAARMQAAELEDELKEEATQTPIGGGAAAPVGGIPPLPPRQQQGMRRRTSSARQGDALSRHLAPYLSSTESPQVPPCSTGDCPSKQAAESSCTTSRHSPFVAGRNPLPVAASESIFPLLGGRAEVSPPGNTEPLAADQPEPEEEGEEEEVEQEQWVPGPFGLEFDSKALRGPADKSASVWKEDLQDGAFGDDEEFVVEALLAEVNMRRRVPGAGIEIKTYFCVKWSGFETDPFHCSCWQSEDELEEVEALARWKETVASSGAEDPMMLKNERLSELECCCPGRRCQSLQTKLPSYGGEASAAPVHVSRKLGNDLDDENEEEEEMDEDTDFVMDNEQHTESEIDEETSGPSTLKSKDKRKRKRTDYPKALVGCPTELPQEGSKAGYPLCLFEQVEHPEVKDIYPELLKASGVKLNSLDIDGSCTTRKRLYYTDIIGHKSAASFRLDRQSRKLREIIGWPDNTDFPKWFRNAVLHVDSNGKESIGTILSKPHNSYDGINAAHSFLKENPNQPLPNRKRRYHITASHAGVFNLHHAAAEHKWVPCPKRLVRQLKTEEVCELMGFPADFLGDWDFGPMEIRKFLGESFHVPTIELLLAPLLDAGNGLAGKCEEGLVVLSLCDGIGAAAVALHNLDIKVDKYIIVEIEAKRTQIAEGFLKRHFPETEVKVFLQPVSEVKSNKDFWSLLREGVDLLVCGSPCSNLSRANRQNATSMNGRCGLVGTKSRAFFDCVTIRDMARGMNPANDPGECD